MTEPRVGQRRSLLRLSLALATASATGCLGDSVDPVEFRVEEATLVSRPVSPGVDGPTPGFTAINLGGTRDGFIYVPASYDHSSPAPLVLLLHGGGETSLQWHSDEVSGLADEFGFVLIAPDARGRTWDLVNDGRFSGDVTFIDAALDRVFELCNIDKEKLVIAGFSDGASYALSLGLINGDLFTKVVGWSPGLIFAPVRRGQPDVFISHGSNDPVLPASNTRDNIVTALRGAGYMVEFVEFNGTHSLPLSVARSTFEWIQGATP